MSIENSEIAKAFSSHNFEKVYPLSEITSYCIELENL